MCRIDNDEQTSCKIQNKQQYVRQCDCLRAHVCKGTEHEQQKHDSVGAAKGRTEKDGIQHARTKSAYGRHKQQKGAAVPLFRIGAEQQYKCGRCGKMCPVAVTENMNKQAQIIERPPPVERGNSVLLCRRAKKRGYTLGGEKTGGKQNGHAY